jgi:predicted kinase
MMLFLPAPTDRNPMTRLILMCGLPGAGKTTRAIELAVRLSAVRFTPDEWLAALGLELRDEPTRARLEAQLWAHTLDLLRLGPSVIIDYGLWARAERDEKRQAARTLGVPVELHYLPVPFDELVRRVQSRNATGPLTITRDELAVYAALFQPPGPDELRQYDEPT